MPKARKLLARVAAVFLLIAISYLRHTYYLNPNFRGGAFFVPIRGEATDSGEFAFVSMIVFFVLYGAVNWLFGQVFFDKIRRRLMLYVFAGILILSALFFGFYKLSGFMWLFHTGSILKNFILSPVYTLMAFFVLKQLATQGNRF